MIDHLRKSVDRHPTSVALVGVASVALALNLFTAADHVEASKPNITCTGRQEIFTVDHPTTTADGIFEARVKTLPTEDLKRDRVMQPLAQKLAEDPASVNPTTSDVPRYYRIPPDAKAVQVKIDSEYPSEETFYWPTECHRISGTTPGADATLTDSKAYLAVVRGENGKAANELTPQVWYCATDADASNDAESCPSSIGSNTGN